jgi:hypothetical protein
LRIGHGCSDKPDPRNPDSTPPKNLSLTAGKEFSLKKTVFKRVLISASVLALGFATQMGTASAATVHPMTLDNCETFGNGVYQCMYIEGSGDSAIEIRGWSDPGSGWIGYDMHEQVVEPNGNTFCNSATAKISSSSQVISCQGGPLNIPTGAWCAIAWAYEQSQEGSEYVKAGTTCATVTV